MTSAVAAVAAPSVACALALPAEDAASSVAAPARAREVGWAQRAANVLFGAPSARRACGGAETSFTPKVLRNEKWRRRRETGSVFAVDRKGGAGEGGLPRIWVSEPAPDGRGRTFVASYPCGADRGGWRAPGAGGGLFQRGSGPAGRGASAPPRRLLPRGRDAPSACGGPGQYRRPLPSSASSTRAICARGRTGTAWPIARRSTRRTPPATSAPTCTSPSAPIMGHGECCWRLGDLVARGSGMRFLGGSGFLAVPASLRFGERAHRRGPCEYGQTAALRLARAFELGRGCEQDFRRARTWYRLAAIGPRRRLRRRSVALQARAHRGSPRGGPHGPGDRGHLLRATRPQTARAAR